MIQKMSRPLDSEDAAYLLWIIVSPAGDLLNRTYSHLDKARSLVKSDDSLLKALEDALEKKEFADIQSLSESLTMVHVLC